MNEITQFLDLEKAGIITILGLTIYLMNKFFNSQIKELKDEIKTLKEEYKSCQKDSMELREEFNNLQLKMLEVISNNTQAFNKFNIHYETLFNK